MSTLKEESRGLEETEEELRRRISRLRTELGHLKEGKSSPPPPYSFTHPPTQPPTHLLTHPLEQEEAKEEEKEEEEEEEEEGTSGSLPLRCWSV